MNYITLIKESAISGTIASLVMMPAGLAFKFFEFRIGHYGPKLGALLFDDPSRPLLFIQHLVIGFLSALPIIFGFLRFSLKQSPIILGAVYGMAYYVLINSFLLPHYFNDPTPWQLGISNIIPSLVVHVIFGASIGFTARHLTSPIQSTSCHVV